MDVSTIDDVLAEMRRLDRGLPHADGVAVFNRVYLEVTELVLSRLGQGFFDDAPTMTRLDVLFAGLYLDAVDLASRAEPVPSAWEPLFEARSRADVVPIQFALAGMNAHINHDLALAVVATCRDSGREPPDIHADYERVNELLASVVRPIRQSFLDQVVVTAGAPLSPVADLLSSWSIEAARDAAWVHVEVLWELRGQPLLADRYGSTLARTVGLVGRQLLLPVAE